VDIEQRDSINSSCLTAKSTSEESVPQQVLRHGKTGGFKFILKEGRPDLSVEALVLDPQWTHLFSADDQKMAREKLTPLSK
jgi:hypothetical protein